MAKSLMHCLLGSLIAGLALAAPVEEHHEKRAPQIASISNTLPLRKESYQQKEGSSPSSIFRNHRALNFNIAADDPEAAHNGKALAARNQIAYITDVKAGPGTYQLIIDTGSSDTWFVKKGFQCRNYRKQPIPLEQCMFGPEFQGDFPGGKIAGQRFSIAYGDGNGPYLQGEMGYSDMTVSGMTVPKQQIALATTGAWDGDGVTSGILGLGLPALTEAFNGTSDNAANLVTYDPFVTTVAKQDVPPIFSLALARESNRSFLSFGGVPPEAKTDGNWATTKILKLERVSGGSDYFYYTIQPDGFVWNTPSGTNQTARSPMIIVDSGTTLNLLPYQIAQAINNAFVPRAALDSQMGGWFVPCDAKAPDLGVTIGGKTIWTNPSNMILPQVRHPITGECATGIGATNGFPYILGDTFMQELVSVFDISDKMELRFAKRTD